MVASGRSNATFGARGILGRGVLRKVLTRLLLVGFLLIAVLAVAQVDFKRNAWNLPQISVSDSVLLDGSKEQLSQLVVTEEAAREAQWYFRAALAELNSDRRATAFSYAKTGAQLGGARCWFLATTLAHLGAGKAPRISPDLGVAWGENPSFLSIRDLLASVPSMLGKKASELSRIRRISHFGTWPENLEFRFRDLNRLKSTELASQTTAKNRILSRDESLEVLQQDRANLLLRLRRPDPARSSAAATRRKGTAVLLSFIDAKADLLPFADELRRSAERFPQPGLVYLWLIIDGGDKQIAAASRLLGDLEACCFVVTSKSGARVRRPGMLRHGARLLMDRDGLVRAVVPPGIPLAVINSQLREYVPR